MPSLLRTLFLQAGKLDVPTHPGCEAREHDMGRWTKGRSWSDSCQDLREDEALHFGWKHECLRQDMMVLNLFNAPTWLTSLVDSTFKNTSHLQVSMVEKKPQNLPSPSLSLSKANDTLLYWTTLHYYFPCKDQRLQTARPVHSCSHRANKWGQVSKGHLLHFLYSRSLLGGEEDGQSDSTILWVDFPWENHCGSRCLEHSKQVLRFSH